MNISTNFDDRDSPRPWQWHFMTPASAQAEAIHDLYIDVMGILVAVAGVIGTIIYLTFFTKTWSYFDFVRGSRERNFLSAKRPSIAYTHNTVLEIIWTIIPCVLLFIIAIPSFTLALALDEEVNPWLWVKVFGNQWFWSYEYSTLAKNGDFDRYQFECTIVNFEDLKDPALRLLETDFSIVIPYDRPTRFLITSNDVLHSWAIPSMGVKVDACPGRINSVTVLPKRPGVYYGQCSEICGVGHGFMPIMLEVVY